MRSQGCGGHSEKSEKFGKNRKNSEKIGPIGPGAKSRKPMGNPWESEKVGMNRNQSSCRRVNSTADLTGFRATLQAKKFGKIRKKSDKIGKIEKNRYRGKKQGSQAKSNIAEKSEKIGLNRNKSAGFSAA